MAFSRFYGKFLDLKVLFLVPFTHFLQGLDGLFGLGICLGFGTVLQGVLHLGLVHPAGLLGIDQGTFAFLDAGDVVSADFDFSGFRIENMVGVVFSGLSIKTVGGSLLVPFGPFRGIDAFGFVGDLAKDLV